MNTLHNLRIGARLALSFAGILVLIGFMAVTAFVNLSGAEAQTAQLTGPQMERMRLAAEWRENILVNSQRTLAIVLSSDRSLSSHFTEDIRRVTARTSEIQKQFAEMEKLPGEQEILDKIGRIRKVYVEQRDNLLRNSGTFDAADVKKTTDEFKAVVQSYTDVSHELFKFERSRTEELGRASMSELTGTKTQLVVTAVACALLACGLGWLLSRSIVRPLALAEAAAGRIASGDLGTEVPQAGHDEVGRLLRSVGSMQDSLRHLVADIRSSVDSISTASSEVAAGNQDLSARTEQASANLQQTASAVEQISGTMRQSSDAANEANRLARSASEVAHSGGQAVLCVVGTMETISQSSQRISDIVSVIDGIAFQTNILALNAAVEAARAGEQGRGFAVVASEVRALAQRSATAAKEIKGLITESVERIATGAQEAQDAGRTIEGVVVNVQRVSDIVREITTAANEQARGIEEVNQAVGQLDRVTQQNAALVEQSAAAAASLRDQADTLARSVQRFRLA
jgi:methyl-accepting chemotaxis protein